MTRARRVAAAALAVGTVWSAPAASAVVPPVVDDALLPPAGPPAPPGPTEPTGACITAAEPPAAEGRTQLSALDLVAAHRLSRGSGQVVAVIDTGVNPHRLLPRLIAGGDYVSNGDGTRDCDGHGTAVAGIVAASASDDGFTGVAPDAAILAIRQSSNMFRLTEAQTAAPSGVGDVETLAQAVRTAADLGASVITVSSVACIPVENSTADGIADGALGAALAYAVDVRNAVVVAAAGNVGGQCGAQNPAPKQVGTPDWSGVTVVASPAWYDEYVLTVGSVGVDGRPSSFSLAGPWVDVAAPGEAVVSLSPDGDRLTGSDAGGPLSGTSYAAPVVAGVAALIRARAPHLTARQVVQRIEGTARRPAAGWDPVVGSGLVDAVAALGADGAPANPAPGARAVEAPRPPADRESHAAAFGGAALAAAVAGIAALTARRLRSRDVTLD